MNEATENESVNIQPDTLRILSIDAWRDGSGWQWNNWHAVGEISKADFEAVADDNRKLLRWLRDNGPLSRSSAGICAVEDDGYNVVICERGNGMPVFAIEYGPAY